MPDRYAISEYFNRSLASTWGTVTDVNNNTHTWTDLRNNSATNNAIFQMSNSFEKATLNIAASGGWQGASLASSWQPYNGDVLVLVQIPTAAQSNCAVGVIVGRPPHTVQAYRFYEVTYSSWDNQFRIRSWNGASFAGATVTQRQTVGYSPVRGEFYWIRVRVEGSRVKARLWRANATAEPSTWNLDVAKSMPTDSGVCWGGVIAYNGMASAQTFRFLQYQLAETNGSGVITDYEGSWGGYVTETFDERVCSTLGRTPGRQQWFGDQTLNPRWYHNKVSDMWMQPYAISKGDEGYYALFRNDRAISVNLWRSNLVGSTLNTGRAYGEFNFTWGGTNQRYRLVMRGLDDDYGGYMAPVHDNIGIGVEVCPGWTYCVLVHANTNPLWISFPFIFELNVRYALYMQIRNQRVYVKAWRPDGEAEPAEWAGSWPLPYTINDWGYSGFSTYTGGTQGSAMVLYHFFSDPLTFPSYKYGSVPARQIKFTCAAAGKVVKKGQFKTPIIRFTRPSYTGKRVRRSTVTGRQAKFVSTAYARKRNNFAASVYIGGVLTKVNYLNNLTLKINRTINPKRVRKGTLARQLKLTAASSLVKRVRKASITRPITTSANFADQIIPGAQTELTADFGISALGVRVKKGATTANMKVTRGTIAPVRRRSGSTSLLSKFKIRALIPGKILGEVQADVTASLTAKPIVRLVGNVDRAIKFSTNTRGLVSTTHIGSFTRNIRLQATTIGTVKRRTSFAGSVSVRPSVKPIKMFATEATGSIKTGLVVDRPDFDIIFADVIDKRSSLIHYACKRMTREQITIEYKHRRTMDIESKTYFIARSVEGVIILLGYAVNRWEENIVMVTVIDTNTDPLIPELYTAFGIENVGIAQ